MTSFEPLEQPGARFETTPWSLVSRLRDGTDDERAHAQNELARTYWPPVYAFLRTQGLRADEAAEATQAFFADVVVGRELLTGARAENGRLRTWVLRALRRYMIDRSRRSSVRGGRVTHIAIDAPAAERLLPAKFTDADHVYERAWATAIVQEAARRCEEHFRNHGKAPHWQLFESQVIQPLCTPSRARPLAEAGAAHGFPTAMSAAAALQVVKKAFVSQLRLIAAEGAEGGAEGEDEYLRLRELLGV